MPCPKLKNFSGNDGEVQSSFHKSRTAAAAAVRALVPPAAQSACIQQALDAGHCPADCPYPYTTNVAFSITRVTTDAHWLANISPVGWFTRIFDGHWWYYARAEFSYRGFVGCRKQQNWYAVADAAEAEGETVA